MKPVPTMTQGTAVIPSGFRTSARTVMEGGIPMTQCKQPWWVENEERDKQKRKAKDDEIDRLKRRVEELEETIENGFDHTTCRETQR